MILPCHSTGVRFECENCGAYHLFMFHILLLYVRQHKGMGLPKIAFHVRGGCFYHKGGTSSIPSWYQFPCQFRLGITTLLITS